VTLAAVITAAGSGSRLGRDLPKALVPIDGVPLVRWAASSLASVTDRIVVTVPADAIDDFVVALDGVAANVLVVPGGATRQESVARGLAELADLAEDDTVLIHDAARPFMPVSVFGRLLEAIEHHDAAIPVIPLVDTVVSAFGGEVSYLDRDRLGAVQTPQAFRIGAVRDAHKRAAADGIVATDDASLVLHYGYTLTTVEGDPLGRKVTFPEDVEAFERRMSSR